MKTIPTILLVTIVGIINCEAQQRYVKDTPPSAAIEFHTKAQKLYGDSNNNYNNDSILAAIYLLDSAISIDSYYAPAYYWKTELLGYLGKYNDALKTLKKVELLTKAQPFEEGKLYYRLHMDDSVHACFERELKNYSNLDSTSYNIRRYQESQIHKGLMLMLLDRNEEANQIFQYISYNYGCYRSWIDSYTDKTKDLIINSGFEHHTEFSHKSTVVY